MKYALTLIASIVLVTVVFVATRPEADAMPMVVIPVKLKVICQALQNFEKSTNVNVQECK